MAAPALAQGVGTGATAASASRLRWLIVGVGFVLLKWVVPLRDWHPLSTGDHRLQLLGLPILLGATAFTLWARAALGTMWSSAPLAREHHQLRTEGPYGITRHPIYTGLLGMLAGTAFIEGLGRWVAFFMLGVLLVGLKIRAEERLLERALGAAHNQYRQRVPLLPAVLIAPAAVLVEPPDVRADLAHGCRQRGQVIPVHRADHGGQLQPDIRFRPERPMAMDIW